MKSTTRRGIVTKATLAAALALGVVAGTATATADDTAENTENTVKIDSTANIVDRDGLRVHAIQQDTSIQFVPPLDGNPLTREWFHDGTAAWQIEGEGADEWEGEMCIGYQVGYPASFDGKLTFEWTTPGLEVEGDGAFTVDGLLPQAGVEMEVGFGPGIEDVEAACGEIGGEDGFIKMHGFHGTVTGVVGPTNIRPYVTVTSANGDTVTTYGEPWTL